MDKIKSIIWKIKKKFLFFLLNKARKNKNYKSVSTIRYYLFSRRKINWEKPEDLNQWIIKLIHTTDIKNWSKLADKYLVRNYIKEKGYTDILVPLYKVWDSPSLINFDELPSQFILKLNNGSGDAIIIEEKSTTNYELLKKHINNIWNIDYSILLGEKHYADIKPLIIAEKLLEKEKQPVKSSSLIDYKFWCFNGKVESVFVCLNRETNSLDISLYDTNWIEHTEWLNFNTHYHKSSKSIPKPVNFNKMIKIAEDLSKGHPQMRVDFYEVNKKLYFGEITLTSAAGQMDYFTKEYLEYLGVCCGNAYKEINNDKLKNLSLS